MEKHHMNQQQEKVPDISNLVPFYAPGMYYVTPEEREKKLNIKAIECRMVGYDEKAKNAYRVWIPSKKMVLTRRDVIFDESREWDSPDKENESDLC